MKQPSEEVFLFSATALVFMVMKLMGIIDWAWYWVFAPIWMPLVVAVVVTIIAVICSR